MQIEKKYLLPYYEKAAIEQVAAQYKSQGYYVQKEARIGNYRVDLLAEKDEEKIVIEVKSHKLHSDSKRRIANIADYIKSLGGYRFVIAIVTPPINTNVSIEALYTLLFDHLINNLPDELDLLSTHTSISEIDSISISSINISDLGIEVDGDGYVSVELQYGSDGDQRRDDGYNTTMTFPFNYTVLLQYRNDKLILESVDKLVVDISEY